MGLLAGLLEQVPDQLAFRSIVAVIGAGFISFIVVAVVVNVLRQLMFRDPNLPPVVFHWVPVVGSTIAYGIDPYQFFFACQKKYGDVFTFILLGKKVTVYLGPKGNEIILNGKLKDVCAEEVYSPLTTPVFGAGVVYDCPNWKLMEQKKMVKFGLTAGALRSYVPLITDEVMAFINRSPVFKGSQGVFNVAGTMAEMTIYTASGSLQGKEVRNKFDSSFADLYHDLDMGFSPINFMLPWAPLPHNKKRDYAQRTMAQVYLDIIRARRQPGVKKDSDDMIWNLMSCRYKDGSEIPDTEIAHMMIALLMAGQHSSSATIAWIILRLASRPDITEELYAEQRAVLGSDLPPLTYDTLQRLPLHAQVVKETLRLHAPIHSIMRKVKTPIQTPDSPYTIPTSHVLLSAPGVTSKTAAHFPDPTLWEPHRWDAGSPLNVVGNPFDAAEEEKEDYGYGMVSKGASSPYLPFGAGRHRCIGESFAYVQLGTITVAMVRMFRFRNVEGAAAFCGTDYSSLFSRPINPAIVRWERRTEETGGDDGEKR